MFLYKPSEYFANNFLVFEVYIFAAGDDLWVVLERREEGRGQREFGYLVDEVHPLV